MRLSRIHSDTVLDFYTADLATSLELPLFGTGVSAGFPSPAEDYVELALDLNKELVKHPAATFYARVKGSSMIDAGIEDGDLLVIDKALEPKDGSIAVCYIDGEFTVKRLAVQDDGSTWFRPMLSSNLSKSLKRMSFWFGDSLPMLSTNRDKLGGCAGVCSG